MRAQQAVPLRFIKNHDGKKLLAMAIIKSGFGRGLHGHGKKVGDWPNSSFHRYVRGGIFNLRMGG